MAKDNQYDSEIHEEPVVCPRPNCREQNAPPEADEFYPRCWSCNEHLDIQPVSAGDEVVLDIDDIHGNGAGVGHTEDGFVVLIDGVLPEKQVKAEVTKVKQSFAWGEVIEVLADEIPEDEDDTDDENEPEDDTEALGRRGDWWGR